MALSYHSSAHSVGFVGVGGSLYRFSMVADMGPTKQTSYVRNNLHEFACSASTYWIDIKWTWIAVV